MPIRMLLCLAFCYLLLLSGPLISTVLRGTETSGLLQLRVFGLGGDEDGNVAVGVSPEREEILMRGTGL